MHNIKCKLIHLKENEMYRLLTGELEAILNSFLFYSKYIYVCIYILIN